MTYEESMNDVVNRGYIVKIEPYYMNACKCGDCRYVKVSFVNAETNLTNGGVGIDKTVKEAFRTAYGNWETLK